MKLLQIDREGGNLNDVYGLSQSFCESCEIVAEMVKENALTGENLSTAIQVLGTIYIERYPNPDA